MDRLTTGRRHTRAGSVTVSELLIRQAAPPRCADSSRATHGEPVTPAAPVVAGRPNSLFTPVDRTAPAEHADENATATTATIAAVTALPPTHRKPPARGTQLAKLASLGVAGAVLCGAVTISSMIADQRREAVQPAQRPTIQITGDQALMPDHLGDAKQVAPAPPVTSVAVNQPGAAQDSLAPPTRPPAAAAATPAADGGTTGSSAAHAELDPATDLELVREFYENLPGSPATAFELLAPELVDIGLGEFLQSWSTVREIESLDVIARPDGVLATVRMRLRGGGHLRIQQLLTVAESPRRIVGVQLLSAQRN